MLLDNQLSVIFGYICRNHIHDAEISNQKHTINNHIVEILQYITNNYRNTTLESVAEHYGYAVPYLSRLIKKSTGFSYSSFTGELRYKKACTLLATSNLTLYDICILSGYGCIEHFHRVFKRKSGQTPHAYRKSHQEKLY